MAVRCSELKGLFKIAPAIYYAACQRLIAQRLLEKTGSNTYIIRNYKGGNNESN